MEIKMLSTSAGPNGVRHQGEKYNVTDTEADTLIRGRYAEYTRPHVAAQTAEPAPAKVAVKVEAKSPSVEAPASQDAVIIAKIALVTKTADLYQFQVEGRSKAVDDAINTKGNELHALEQKAAWGKAK